MDFVKLEWREDVKNVVKLEIKRAICNQRMVAAVFIGCLINIAHVVQRPYQCYLSNQNMDFLKYPLSYPSTVIDTWICADMTSMESFLFFLILPLLATLPYGTSYFVDKQSGMIKSLYVRVSRREYLVSKYIATFLAGGIVVIMPLIVNLLCCMSLLPNLLPQTIYPGNAIDPNTFLCSIFYSFPTLYLVIYLIIDFLLAGIFACIALSCSFITDYRIVVAFCPFFLQLVINTLCGMFLDYEWSCVYFARSGYGIQHISVLFIYVVGGFIATVLIFLLQGEKEDVF